MRHKKLKEKALSNPEVRAEYEALEPEFELLRTLVKARQEAGLSQTEVAKRMGTKPPSVARLESLNAAHSPSVRTLKRYAQAVGCRLEIHLVPQLKK